VAADRSAAAFTTDLEAALDLVDPDPAYLQTPRDIDRSFAALQSAKHPIA